MITCMKMKSFILKYASKIMFYDVNITCYQRAGPGGQLTWRVGPLRRCDAALRPPVRAAGGPGEAQVAHRARTRGRRAHVSTGPRGRRGSAFGGPTG